MAVVIQITMGIDHILSMVSDPLGVLYGSFSTLYGRVNKHHLAYV